MTEEDILITRERHRQHLVQCVNHLKSFSDKSKQPTLKNMRVVYNKPISWINFLSIPKFFDYDNRQKIIKEYLTNYYDLEITNYSLIEYKIFPFCRLVP